MTAYPQPAQCLNCDTPYTRTVLGDDWCPACVAAGIDIPQRFASAGLDACTMLGASQPLFKLPAHDGRTVTVQMMRRDSFKVVVHHAKVGDIAIPSRALPLVANIDAAITLAHREDSKPVSR